MTDSLPGLIVMIFAAQFLQGFDGVFRPDKVLISRMKFSVLRASCQFPVERRLGRLFWMNSR